MKTPNVLLVILDAARARNMGLYGHHRETTPFLKSYADRATVYTQARSPGIHSVASHASIWSGYEVEEHAVVRHRDTLSPTESVWYDLGEQGYKTGLFTKNAIVAHSSNLAEPFDYACIPDYIDTKEKLFPDAYSPRDISTHEGIVGNFRRIIDGDYTVKSFLNSAYHVARSVQNNHIDSTLSSDELVEDFVNWQEGSSSPWAACINLIDAHFPYEPDDQYDQWGGKELKSLQSEVETTNAEAFIKERPWWKLEALEHLYDGAILQADAGVRRLIQELEAAGVHEDTLVIITSDHGEGFGEVSRLNGRTRLVDHNWGIHEALTHVPLIVSSPDQSEGEIVNEVVSLTEFRSVVDSVLGSRDTEESFTREGPVFSSTTRLHESDASIFNNSKYSRNAYLGPWKAVYEDTEGGVRKYAAHRHNSIVVEIEDSQQSYVLDIDEAGTVDEAYSTLTKKEIKKSRKDMTDQVKQNLTDLGYM